MLDSFMSDMTNQKSPTSNMVTGAQEISNWLPTEGSNTETVKASDKVGSHRSSITIAQ